MFKSSLTLFWGAGGAGEGIRAEAGRQKLLVALEKELAESYFPLAELCAEHKSACCWKSGTSRHNELAAKSRIVPSRSTFACEWDLELTLIMNHALLQEQRSWKLALLNTARCQAGTSVPSAVLLYAVPPMEVMEAAKLLLWSQRPCMSNA